ncbi:MAG: AMIN-like domain-containing (lipo)protein [Jiangellaceae bacterium]
MSYDWATPSDEVTVAHPAEIPLPYLVAIYVGDHPEGSPPYQRISFYFRDAFPEYNLQYVRSVLEEGSGAPISLQGNGFLRVGFVNAQAHDDAGASTVETAPDTTIGFTNLKSYGFAGDFEGHLTYGLGIQVAPNSDQVLQVRAGELTRSDGSDGLYYVVYVDVQTG